MEDALCAQTDPELFFPEKSGTAEPAKRVCQNCPVINECLTYALDNGFVDGVWGGTSGNERRRMRPGLGRGIGRRAQRISEMEQFVAAGMSAHDIADAFGCSFESMERWCERVKRPEWTRMFRRAA